MFLDRDALGPLSGDPPDPPERVVGPIAGRADDHRDRGRPAGGAAGDPLGHVQDRRDAGLVVSEVNNHDPAG